MSGAIEPDLTGRDQRYPPAMKAAARQLLAATSIGSRVVARYRIPGGFTDALGYVRGHDESGCSIETRRGVVTVALADVVAAKPVPEPPARHSA